MTARARPAAAFAAGSLREEATLHLEGLYRSAGSMAVASAEVEQGPSLVLAGGAALVGPELFQAPADLRADVNERTMVMAGNRLVLLAVAVIVTASALSLAGMFDPGQLLSGIGSE